jgi:hypothetical protein
MASADLINTLIAEAGGEGDAGLIAAAWAIQQRAAARGLTPDQVIKSGFDGYTNPGSGAQQAQKNPALRAKVERIVNGVANGTIPNPVPGADHFLSGNVMPSWAKGMKHVATVGGHRFYASGNVPQKAYGPLIPPEELPEVATLTDTKMPARAPMPATISPDLSLMRNPQMSAQARQAQVTPTGNVPLPRPRPSAPDIVTPTMASLQRPQSRANTTRAADIGLVSQNGVTPRLTDDGSDIYSYHIPGITPTSVVGGRGSLTPSVGATPRPAQQSPHLAATRARDQDLQMALNQRYPPTRLPPLPPSNLGKPPIERVVQSVPVRPAAAPTPQEIAAAPGGRVVATVPSVAPVPRGSAAQNIQQQRLEQASLRPARVPDRLPVGVQAQAYDEKINGPAGLTRQQFAALPPYDPAPQLTAARLASIAPVPMPATMRPASVLSTMAARSAAPVASARRAQQQAPLRIVVQRDRPVQAPMPTMRLTPAQQYAMANARNYQPSVEDRVRGSSGSSGAQSIYG